MALSEKLYTLRKKSGLSQEQLAEQLKISRQAISKWESGASSPESDKLIALSNYFNVSLDYLMKEDNEQSKDTPQATQSKTAQAAERTQRSVGLIICIGGIICLIVWPTGQRFFQIRLLIPLCLRCFPVDCFPGTWT